jgi:hypothetical protein
VRHYRYGCQARTPSYPSHFNFNPTYASSVTAYSLRDDKAGEERVLPNLLAFDVRVYDPSAPILQDADGTTALQPGDAGYRSVASAGSPTAIGYGAYVDLNYNRTGMTGSSNFSGQPSASFNLSAPTNLATQPYNFHIWDTWATTYEMTNFGFTGFPGTGRAFNGLDDDGQNGVDDPAERQTQPPYYADLRGIQVRIRVYEPQTRQMRQMTVGADFVAD